MVKNLAREKLQIPKRLLNYPGTKFLFGMRRKKNPYQHKRQEVRYSLVEAKDIESAFRKLMDSSLNWGFDFYMLVSINPLPISVRALTRY